MTPDSTDRFIGVICGLLLITLVAALAAGVI